MTPLSRRDFVALAAAGAAVTPFTLTDGVASAALTAQEIVDRVKKSIGVDWRSDDVDTFKIGDPSTVVTGVVTTSMATLNVLQKAVQAGANFIITAAPTFYSRADMSTAGARGGGVAAVAGRGQVPGRGAGPGPGPASASGPGTGASAPMPPAPALPAPVVPPRQAAAPPATPSADPIYEAKNAFIARHKLVVFRLTHHWNQRKPDPRVPGLAATM